MNRRSFLQSLAALSGSVAIGIRPGAESIGKKSLIDYSLFCDDPLAPTPRFNLLDPFSVGEHVYASDCRILVRHPGVLTGEASGRVPDVSQLWWEEFDSPGWGSLHQAEYVYGKPGHVMALCGVCLGRGVVGKVFRCTAEDCEFDREVGHGCPHCVNGWVGAKCTASGCRKGDVEFREIIGGSLFCPSYMSRVRSLGNIEYRIIRKSDGVVHGPTDVMLFRGEGGVQGFLCGMDPKKVL